MGDIEAIIPCSFDFDLKKKKICPPASSQKKVVEDNQTIIFFRPNHPPQFCQLFSGTLSRLVIPDIDNIFSQHELGYSGFACYQNNHGSSSVCINCIYCNLCVDSKHAINASTCMRSCKYGHIYHGCICVHSFLHLLARSKYPQIRAPGLM